VTPTLAQIRVYPIKGLDPAIVSEATIAPGGALVPDRRWALFDPEGNAVNGKKEPAVHGIRCAYALGADGRVSVSLSVADGRLAAARFDLEDDGPAVAAWLGRALGRAVELRRNDVRGFPDDVESAGPTVVSTASLATVASWFPGLGGESTRRRFRANLEIAGVDPFWEDRLCGDAGAIVRFQIGDVEVLGTNPCQRCVVPSRDPDTGLPLPLFQKIFTERRRDSLPAWAAAARFNHHYRFTVNTNVPASEAGKRLRVGDPVRLLG
jgi:uncharacterized protein YcbX